MKISEFSDAVMSTLEVVLFQTVLIPFSKIEASITCVSLLLIDLVITEV